MTFKSAYQNVLNAAYDVKPSQIKALTNELSQIFYQLQCSKHFQASVESLDYELWTIYQEDMANQSNRQPSLLANLVFPPLAVQLDQYIRVHKSGEKRSNLLQALKLPQMTHHDVLVNRYIRTQLFSPYAEKIKQYTPLRKPLFLATLRLLIELNPSAGKQKAPNVLVESLGYTWETINGIMEGSRDGLALLKLYYEQRLYEKVALHETPNALKKHLGNSNDGLVKALWAPLQRGELSQSGNATFGKRERRVPRLKYGLAALVLVLWVIVIGLLGFQSFTYFKHNQLLQQENNELLVELKKSQ